MKQWLKKTGLIAAGVVALTSVVSAVPVSADASRVVYFSIQSNTACNSTDRFASFMFNLTNVNGGSDASNVSVFLYSADGTSLTDVGLNIPDTAGYTTNFVAGTSFTLNGQKTASYNQSYGFGQALPCTKRPAWGKIVVDSEYGRFIASAEMRATRTTNGQIMNNSTVVINNSQPF
ncbi:hypothetical protein [Cohnella sp. GbtcB17]|uniref:hypothetical protein n=1 Tax=Cohnella sp. GbtcB17 TaxID=2824762 RepID=UPI001C2FE865|nr:hypothetical protein [Cohnella sp. GbtcB17]